MKKKQRVKREKKVSRFSDLTLPTEFSEPLMNIGGCSMLIFGEKGIGKTSLAAQFPKTFFIFTDPGGKFLRLKRRPVNHWREVVKYLDLLDEAPGKFLTVCIDTMDRLYELCFDYMCEEVMMIEHPNDENDRGKSWKRISKEFTTQILRAFPDNSGRGLVMISHAAEKEITLLSGDKFDRIVPSMGASPTKILAGLVDLQGYYFSGRGRKRFLQITPDEFIDAKCRPEESFRTTKGERVHTIPMGSTSKEAYTNLVKAFNNEQTEGGEDALKLKTEKSKKKGKKKSAKI